MPFSWIYSETTPSPFLTNCIVFDVQPVFMCFNGESFLPLQIPFLQSSLATSPFRWLTSRHFSTIDIFNFAVWWILLPMSSIFQLVFLELATKQWDFLKPYSVFVGSLRLWSIHFPDWKLEWHMPVQTPRACLSLLLLLPLHPLD